MIINANSFQDYNIVIGAKVICNVNENILRYLSLRDHDTPSGTGPLLTI